MDAVQPSARPRAGIGRYVVALLVAFATDAVLFFVVSLTSGLLFQLTPGLGLWTWLASAAIVIAGGAFVGTRVARLSGFVPLVVVLVLNLALSAFGLWAAISWAA